MHLSRARVFVVVCTGYLSLVLPLATAQCGPNSAFPFPPGSTTCPTGPGVGDGGGAPGGDTGDTTTTSTCATTADLPCEASHLGTVAWTTVSGSIATKSFDPNEDVYGPFEAGFGSQQDGILSGLGCAIPSDGYVAGGLDTMAAASIVIVSCGINLTDPWDLGLLDECGGHTNEYHFHERLTCLWAGQQGADGHSIRIAKIDGAPTDQYLYGKYEDEDHGVVPLLDACGGHYGVTPESNGVPVYHYHVQDAAPFTVGCIGPNADGTLVTVEECRAADSGCGDGDTASITTLAGSSEYDLWCPCFDGDGSNVGTMPLAVFAADLTVETTPPSGAPTTPPTAPPTTPPTTPPTVAPTAALPLPDQCTRSVDSQFTLHATNTVLKNRKTFNLETDFKIWVASLAECQRRCVHYGDGMSCLAVEYSSHLGLCWLKSSRGVASAAEVDGTSAITKSNNKYHTYNRNLICGEAVPADECVVESPRSLFTETPETRMQGKPASKDRANTADDCAARCLAETSPQCNSFAYDAAKKWCLLFGTSTNDLKVKAKFSFFRRNLDTFCGDGTSLTL